MRKQTGGIRFWFLQSYFFMAAVGVLIFFIGLQIYLLISNDPSLTLKSTVYVTLFLLAVYTILAVYIGYRSGSFFQSRLANLLSFVTVLRSGKYSARAEPSGRDEIGLIFAEMNELAMYIQEQVRSLQRLADEKSELAEQSRHAAIIEERQRLARDLHDSVSQQLFALSMLSSAALRTVSSNPGLTEKNLEQIASIAAKAQGEMRALLLHLRPIDLRGDTLEEGVNKLVSELKEKTELDIQCKINIADNLPRAMEEHVFRVIQEALSNILRHADAERVRLKLERIDHKLHLYVSDNGKGFELKQTALTSYGLQTMRERCEELGGVFQLRSQTGEGTYIDIRIPIEEKENVNV